MNYYQIVLTLVFEQLQVVTFYYKLLTDGKD